MTISNVKKWSIISDKTIQIITMKSLKTDAIYGVCLSFGAKFCPTYSLHSRQRAALARLGQTIHQAPEPANNSPV